MPSALLRERHLVAQLRDTLTHERGSGHEAEVRSGANLADLRATVDLERSRILELQTALERERLKNATLTAQLQEEQLRQSKCVLWVMFSMLIKIFRV